MKNLIIAVILTMFASSSYASCSQISKSGISDFAHQKLVLACEQARLDELALPTPSDVTATMRDYAQAGQFAKEIAEAVGILAKELGMAVDDFLHTDAGFLIAALLIWKIAGVQIIGFIIGLPLMVLIWILVIKAGKNMFITDRENITVKARFGGERVIQVPQYRRYRDLSDSEATVMWVGTLAAGALTAMILFILVV